MYLPFLQGIRKMFGKHSEDENTYISTEYITVKNKTALTYVTLYT